MGNAVEEYPRLPPECDELWDWFTSIYIRPVEVLPFCTAEGGYQWIYGGPVCPLDTLRDHFDNVPFETVEMTARALIDLSWQWSPRPSNSSEDLEWVG